jgi:hypothetical protein
MLLTEENKEKDILNKVVYIYSRESNDFSSVVKNIVHMYLKNLTSYNIIYKNNKKINSTTKKFNLYSSEEENSYKITKEIIIGTYESLKLNQISEFIKYLNLDPLIIDDLLLNYNKEFITIIEDIRVLFGSEDS